MEGQSLDELQHRSRLDYRDARFGLYVLLKNDVLLRVRLGKAVDLGAGKPHLLFLFFLQHGRIQHALQRRPVLERYQCCHPAVLLLGRLGSEDHAVAVSRDELKGVPVLTLLVILVVDLNLDEGWRVGQSLPSIKSAHPLHQTIMYQFDPIITDYIFQNRFFQPHSIIDRHHPPTINLTFIFLPT